EPTPDAELLRVVEAARQAAQQSRRKVIDGAIVLAAIVGDAKSPAAGLLKTHGMTFDEAIRTLQKASAQARSKQYAASTAPPEPRAGQEAESERTQPAPEPPPPSPASAPFAPPPAASPGPTPPSSGQSVDDILAAARARIQQRSAGARPGAAAGGGTAATMPEPESKPAPKPEAGPEPMPGSGPGPKSGGKAEPPPKVE